MKIEHIPSNDDDDNNNSSNTNRVNSNNHSTCEKEIEQLLRTKLSYHVYEFYMCVISSALKSATKEALLKPFPAHFYDHADNSTIGKRKNFSRLQRCLDTMPTPQTIFSYKNNGPKIEHFSDDQLELLSFLLKNKKHYLQYKSDITDLPPRLASKLSASRGELKPDHIFQVFPSESNADDDFNALAAQYGTVLAFHGSRMENFYSIFRNGLQNFSSTDKMRNGDAFGQGIYFCEEITVAKQFAESSEAWAKSELLGTVTSCVCVCEVVMHPSVKAQTKSRSSSSSSSSSSRVPSSSANNNNNNNNIPPTYIIVQSPLHVRIRFLLMYSHVRDQTKHRQRESKFNTMIFVYVFVLLLVVAIQQYKPVLKWWWNRHYHLL